MTIGIVDVGSNTIRMNIYKINENTFEELLSKKEAVGLVSYIKKNTLTKEGMTVLKDCLSSFKEISTMLHLEGFYVFATASLRNIDNTEEVLSYIQKECNIDIDLLSGQQEARLSFKGATLQLNFEKGLYVDTGGGSTELLVFNKKEMKDIISLPIGSLNLYTKYINQIIPTKKEAKEIVKTIEEELSKAYKKKKKVNDITITGGSMRAVRKLLIRLNRIDEDTYMIKPEVIHELVKELLDMNTKDVIRLFLKVKADRVHTLFTGLLIVDTLAQYIQAKQIQVSTHGVREGYLLERILNV